MMGGSGQGYRSSSMNSEGKFTSAEQPPGMDPNSANLFVQNEEEDENNPHLSNSRDGFESQLQIHIGPHGGTISASRRRNQNISIQQMNADLISAQLERKEKLMGALSSEKTRLAKLRQEITLLRTKLHPLRDLERLKEENQRLRMECDFMTKEVDLYDNGSVPLGETSEEFYRGINPGQDAHELFGFNHNNNRRMLGFGAENERPTLFNAEVDQWVRGMPPPRPPPPRFLPLPPQIDSPNGEWCCSMCTFRNHPDLAHCEQCGMVRVKPPTSREQNIRIRVVRHQQPSHRRVVHSWAV